MPSLKDVFSKLFASSKPKPQTAQDVLAVMQKLVAKTAHLKDK